MTYVHRCIDLQNMGIGSNAEHDGRWSSRVQGFCRCSAREVSHTRHEHDEPIPTEPPDRRRSTTRPRRSFGAAVGSVAWSTEETAYGQYYANIANAVTLPHLPPDTAQRLLRFFVMRSAPIRFEHAMHGRNQGPSGAARSAQGHRGRKGRCSRRLISQRLMQARRKDAAGWRLPAKALEDVVVAELAGLLEDHRDSWRRPLKQTG